MAIVTHHPEGLVEAATHESLMRAANQFIDSLF